MVNFSVVYEGDLRCRLTHGPSGAQISTDAPKDNMGKGEAFSPTDLTVVSLVSCMLTTMAIYAKRHEIKLEKATAAATKEMVSDPVRRIGKIGISIQMPQGLTKDQRETLERAAHTCPVQKSLHPDIVTDVRFNYSD